MAKAYHRAAVVEVSPTQLSSGRPMPYKMHRAAGDGGNIISKGKGNMWTMPFSYVPDAQPQAREFDWNSTLKQVTIAGISLAAEAVGASAAGTVVGLLVDIFWHEDEESVWDQVKAQVQALVGKEIEDLIWSQTTTVISEAKILVQRANGFDGTEEMKPPEGSLQAYQDLYSYMEAKLEAFKVPTPRNERARDSEKNYEALLLPLLVQYANILFTAMRHGMVNSYAWHEEAVALGRLVVPLGSSLEAVNNAWLARHKKAFTRIVARTADYVDRVYAEAKEKWIRRIYNSRNNSDAGACNSLWLQYNGWNNYMIDAVCDYRTLWDYQCRDGCWDIKLTRIVYSYTEAFQWRAWRDFNPYAKPWDTATKPAPPWGNEDSVLTKRLKTLTVWAGDLLDGVKCVDVDGKSKGRIDAWQLPNPRKGNDANPASKGFPVDVSRDPIIGVSWELRGDPGGFVIGLLRVTTLSSKSYEAGGSAAGETRGAVSAPYGHVVTDILPVEWSARKNGWGANGLRVAWRLADSC